MKLKKSETNNAIITTLANVRKHPNADRLKLATVLGTQVIVGLEAKEGDLVIYFDSNLRLSHEYLYHNNLYSNKEMNSNPEVKGYFGKNGRVRAQKLRGEISNGYVAEMDSITLWPAIFTCVDSVEDLKVGDEFTHINDVEICSKYFVESSKGGVQIGTKKKKKPRVWTDMFWKHWDTKQLMRESYKIPPGKLYVEEKIHGTSGRTAHVLFHRRRKWYQIWKPKVTSFWKVVSGTRRRNSTTGHMKEERRDIHEKLAPHVHKGEELYYEIYGYSYGGKAVQTEDGHQFVYDCEKHHRARDWDNANDITPPLPYKVVLYRVTVTTEDGYRIDLDREQVYRRAEEIGLEKPVLLGSLVVHETDDNEMFSDIYEIEDKCQMIIEMAKGKSMLDANTLREGVVVWFKDCAGNWTCLKHKSEEFLMLDSRNKDKGLGDVEDEL